MSKFKKGDKPLTLEELLDEQLIDYLEDIESNFFISSTSDDNNTITVSGDDYYDSLMQLYIKDLEHLTDNLKPTRYQAISGSGPAWYFEPHTRTFIKTERGAPIAVVPGEEDDMGRVLVRTVNTFIWVPKEEILDLGYN